MAHEHSLINVESETWSSLEGPREAYDSTSKTWKTVDATNWSMVGRNTWGGTGWETTLEFEEIPVEAEVIVTCSLIYPTELDFTVEINVVAGETDFNKLLLESLPWYLREDNDIRNVCTAMAAILATVESYLLIVDQSRHLDTAIEMLEAYEDELGIQSGRLDLSQRRDNIRRIWHMMNEDVTWSQRGVYYLPYIGEWSTGNQQVEGTVIHDAYYKSNPIIIDRVEKWSNINGLKVVD